MKPTAFTGKSIFVSGAAGSIGSELCRKMAEQGAKRIVLVSLTEGGLYNIDRALRKAYPEVEFVPVIGSAGNRGLMAEAMRGSEIAVHAAAHKHVPLCESNPIEAIQNNVFGTQALAYAAGDADVRQFCMISTDKAVRPTSIMGATKRLAELLIREMAAPAPRCDFFIVRFGNVMDSAGSVLPLWKEQIAAGGPLTLTDERCERYFMSIPEAVELISRVIALKPTMGTYIFDMKRPKKLVDIAKKLIQESGKSIEIKYIGLRPGEKLTEELHHGGDLEKTEVARVHEVTEPVRDLVDRQKLIELARACSACDRERAVGLLWDLIAQ